MRISWLCTVALVGLIGCGSASSAPSPAGHASDTSAAGVPAGGGGSSGGPSTPGAGGSGGTAVGASGAASGSTIISGGSSGGSSGSSSSSGGAAIAATDAGLPPPAQGGFGILTAGLWDDSLNFDFFGKYLAAHAQIAGDPGFGQSDYQTAHTAFAQRPLHSVVDAALVIDTTGSMSDELSYLTAEFANISNAIQAALPNAAQRWALVLYRDRPDTDPGDEYVVRSFDFTDNAQTFASTIGSQNAASGGDYPEAPELGLAELPKLSWRTDPTVAKIAFWVGDAPHHDQRGAEMKGAILGTLAAGIHLYPVSASGTDDLLELTMRSAAEITGGRYLFLTNDSGVGGPHKIPEIPCYFVTRLAKALVRSVAMEVSGSYIGPDPADVIRTMGAPSTDGTCTTEDGQTVHIF